MEIPKSFRHAPIGCFNHHPSMNLLRQSAEAGCGFCNRLVYAFQGWILEKIEIGRDRPVWVTVEHDQQQQGELLLKVFQGKKYARLYLNDLCR